MVIRKTMPAKPVKAFHPGGHKPVGFGRKQHPAMAPHGGLTAQSHAGRSEKPQSKAVVPPLAQAVRRAESAEKVKDYLLSSLASGVRSPLTIFAEKADAFLKLAPEARDAAAKELAVRARAVARTVDDILDLVDLEPGQGASSTEPCDIGELVDDIVAPFRKKAQAKGVTLSDNVKEMPQLVVNAHRLRLVLRALLDNSVKFTSAGRIGVVASFFGGRFTLTVEDTGCGIPLSEQRRFAEEGLSSAKEGVLPSGLEVIERLVLSMNGEISLKSTPGIGTVITLTFVGVSAAGACVTRRLSAMQRIGTIKIQDQLSWKANFLLVDGSPVHQAAMDGMLKSIGFENIGFASNGNEALVRLMTGAVDIILTELDLDQMDGRKLVKDIRKVDAFAKLPVYAITTDESIVDTFSDLGFDGYLLKPVTTSKLHMILG